MLSVKLIAAMSGRIKLPAGSGTCFFKTFASSTNRRLFSCRTLLFSSCDKVACARLQKQCGFLSHSSKRLPFSGIISRGTRLSCATFSSAATEPVKDDADDKEKLRAKTIKNTKLGLLCLCTGFGAAGIILVFTYGAPAKDENGRNIEDEFSHKPVITQYFLRTWRELIMWDTFIKEPSREKLLPDPLKEPYYQPPYTLVLELTGVLVHPDWTYQTGWRFKKRPAVDYFVSQVGYPVFEVVIYTSEQGFTAFPIIDSLDPNGLIMYRLFRDATKYDAGHHVKDLSKLNRDLSKVIYVDWDPKSFKLQPENALRVPKWNGTDDDTELADLAALLRTIASSNIEDVRAVLEYYNSFDNPLQKFRENQRKLEAEQEALLSAEENKSLTKSWSGRLFGFRRHSAV